METLSTSHVLEVTVWDAQFIAYPMGVARLGPKPISNSKPWMDSQVRCLSVCVYIVARVATSV